ncbi:MAG: hypothetical protein FJY11_03930 [Bacteroidetes bacterium]|nr:hypothetical protein [Bacteroidota bacterium]
MKIKEFVSANLLVILFTVAGLLGGFLYWKYIGCLSGTCRIKSVWYMSTLYGGILGYLGGDIVKSLIRWFSKRRESKGA